MYKPIYSLGSNVTEVEHFFLIISIEGDDVYEILMHEIILRSVDRHVPYVIFVCKYNPRLNFVASFAGMFIGGAFVPVLVTLAVKSAGSIFAFLTANLGCFNALVYICTCLSIIQKLVALVTFAVKSGRCIDAFVTTLVRFYSCTFVDVTVRWLVAFVCTIRFLVAHKILVDTISVRTLEFPWRCAGAISSFRC